MSDYVDLAASCAGGRKGVEGGVLGLLIGGGFRGKGARVFERGAMDGGGASGVGRSPARGRSRA
jgi:hypothetical protein